MKSACLLIPRLNTYVFPIVFIIECGVANKTWRHNQTSFWTHVFVVLVVLSSPTHTLIKYGCSSKKSNQVTPAYLDIFEAFDFSC